MLHKQKRNDDNEDDDIFKGKTKGFAIEPVTKKS